MRTGGLRKFIVLAAIVSSPFILTAGSSQDEFKDGCCVEFSTFPRPKNVSQETVSRHVLLEALHCATNNKYLNDTKWVAGELGNAKALSVAYYYGKYMPEQDGKALTVAVYSTDGKEGWLFDVSWETERYYVANLPPLLRSRNHWRVGEINGGLWSYTRLWYLAQETGSRPRQQILISTIARSKPMGCDAL